MSEVRNRGCMMDLVQRMLWEIGVLFSLTVLFQPDVCLCQRLVQVQGGPLYRAKGYPATISCNVSGFNGPLQQDFQFSIFKPGRPDSEIKIISTAEPDVAYARYAKRVRDGDIEIRRLTGSSVLLHIKTLQVDDGGEYECYTPNTDGTYFGTYSARTRLNVIQDSLLVSSNASALVRSEGESLQLDCKVSTQTFQHTHLSVAWYLRTGGANQSRLIVSLTRDFILKPGKDFEERCRSGLIRLDKMESSTYRLSFLQVLVEDQGEIHCEASEWIQDPDRSWTKIAYKATEAYSLQVRRADVSTMDSFTINITVPEADLQEGGLLEIGCTLETLDHFQHHFSMTWLKGGVTVAQIGPTGILSVSPEYERRAGLGELRVAKMSGRDFLLSIKSARTEDEGEYQCSATSGSFKGGQILVSSAEHVSISVTEGELVVTTSAQAVTVTEGNTLRVTCRLTGTRGLLSIAWQHRGGEGTFGDIISMSPGGVTELGTRYRERAEEGDVRLLHTAPDSFTLEVANALLSDGGVYKCTGYRWEMESAGKMKMTESKSQEFTASVLPVDSIIHIDLKSNTMQAVENEEVELFCRVTGPNIPLSVTWKFQHAGLLSQEEIVSLLHNGGIIWRRESQNYQLRTEGQAGEASFVLRISHASMLEAGRYQCVVEAFLRQKRASLKVSNELAVVVLKPESRLSISVGPSRRLERVDGADVWMECRVLAATSGSSHFAVSWLFHQEGEKNRTLVSVDRSGVAVPGLEAGDHRYSLSRQGLQSYGLLVRQVEARDSGQYYCRVEEWLLDPHRAWYALTARSASLELLIGPKGSSFAKLASHVETGIRAGANCTPGAPGVALVPHYSVTWFFSRPGSSAREPLVRFSRGGGVLGYTGVNEELMGRMRFYRPSMGTFGLVVQNVDLDATEASSCRVDEYQLDCKGRWIQTATDQSGFTSISVGQTGRAPPDPTCSSGSMLTGLSALNTLLGLIVLVLTHKLS